MHTHTHTALIPHTTHGFVVTLFGVTVHLILHTESGPRPGQLAIHNVTRLT